MAPDADDLADSYEDIDALSDDFGIVDDDTTGTPHWPLGAALEEPDPLSDDEAHNEDMDPDSETDVPFVLATDMREALEQLRGSHIQLDYAVRALVEEVRDIGRRQSGYERKYVFNSVFAYVIFCALIATGFYFVYEARDNKDNFDQAYYESEVQRATERLALIEEENKKAQQGSEAATLVYERIEQGLHKDALDLYNDIYPKIINPTEAQLLHEKINALKIKLGEEAYEQGLREYNTEAYEKARDAFRASLNYSPEAPYVPRLLVHLGMAYYKLSGGEDERPDLKEITRRLLQDALDKGENSLSDAHLIEARYYLARVTHDLNMFSEALELYKDFRKHHRYSSKYGDKVAIEIDGLNRHMERKRGKPRAPASP